MSFQVAPGVQTREIDLSLYVPALGSMIFGLIGGARKGETEKLTEVGSIAEYTDKFGIPTTKMGYIAREYLRNGRSLVIVRIGNAEAVATINLTGDATVVADAVILTAVSSGTWANSLSCEITAGSAGAGFVKITFKESGVVVDTIDDIVDTPAAVVTAVNDVLTDDFFTAAVGSAATIVDVQTVSATGGLDGFSALTDSDFIGTIVGDVNTGLKLFRNPETLDLNVVAAPPEGTADGATGLVNTELISLAEDRRDTLALLDPPDNVDTDGILDYANAAGIYSGNTKFDSSYAALYWTWHEIFDPFTNAKVFIPPSGPTANIYAFNDFVTEPWFAPAGLNRGKVRNSLQLRYSPTAAQRERLQKQGECVNPYVNFKSDGIVLMGQRTTQRASTALDRVNVRRMLLFVEKALATVARFLMFEPNDDRSRDRFIRLAESVIGPVQAARGIFDYRVIADDTNNPSGVIDQGQLRGKVLIKPTKTAEIIGIDFTILSTGAEFQEFI